MYTRSYRSLDQSLNNVGGSGGPFSPFGGAQQSLLASPGGAGVSLSPASWRASASPHLGMSLYTHTLSNILGMYLRVCECAFFARDKSLV